MEMTLFLATCIEKSFLSERIFLAVYAFIPGRPSDGHATAIALNTACIE